MTRALSNRRAVIETWSADALRVTTFHLAEVLEGAEGAERWWQIVTGAEPEVTVHKKTAGERTDVGPFADGQLALRVQLHHGRVDWMMTDALEVESQETPPLPSRLSAFVAGITPWLGKCPPVGRLALGMVAELPVKGRKEGYSTLSDYLNFDLDPESTDFHYQINRKRKSIASAGIEINRLMRWSVGTTARQRVTATPQAGLVTTPVGSPEHNCRLELDINTVPVSPDLPLPAGDLTRLLAEMVELGKEIVREGDIP